MPGLFHKNKCFIQLKNSLFALLILTFGVHAQTTTEIEKKYYSNGQLKTQSVHYGADTIEYRSYYKNGQLKDSMWFRIEDHMEIPIFNSRSYFKNGLLSSKNYYGKTPAEHITYVYYSNGKLRYFEEVPTGITRIYNKKGVQIKEYDLHKHTHVYIPPRYENGEHLKSTSFSKLIQTKSASLLSDDKEVKLKTGTLLAYTTLKDTNIVRHCLVEGFSKDSIYLSKFSYSPTFDRIYDYDVLEYKKTYALGINQLSKIYYTANANARRRFGAKACFNIGFAALFIPVLFIPGTAKAVNEGNADYSSLAIGYGSSLIVGATLVTISKKLFKTTVPVKYDMRNWRLITD